jgi:hypothetical protein
MAARMITTVLAATVLVAVVHSRELQPKITGAVSGAGGMSQEALKPAHSRRPLQMLSDAHPPTDDVVDRLTNVFVSKLRRTLSDRCSRRLQSTAAVAPEHPISVAVRHNDLVDGERAAAWSGSSRS